MANGDDDSDLGIADTPRGPTSFIGVRSLKAAGPSERIRRKQLKRDYESDIAGSRKMERDYGRQAKEAESLDRRLTIRGKRPTGHQMLRRTPR
jgi:hypothetical protein